MNTFTNPVTEEDLLDPNYSYNLGLQAGKLMLLRREFDGMDKMKRFVADYDQQIKEITDKMDVVSAYMAVKTL